MVVKRGKKDAISKSHDANSKRLDNKNYFHERQKSTKRRRCILCCTFCLPAPNTTPKQHRSPFRRESAKTNTYCGDCQVFLCGGDNARKCWMLRGEAVNCFTYFHNAKVLDTLPCTRNCNDTENTEAIMNTPSATPANQPATPTRLLLRTTPNTRQQSRKAKRK